MAARVRDSQEITMYYAMSVSDLKRRACSELRPPNSGEQVLLRTQLFQQSTGPSPPARKITVTFFFACGGNLEDR